MNPPKNLETISGPLVRAVEFERLLTSAELMTERRTNPELRNGWFYPGNFALYTMEGYSNCGTEDSVLFFGGNENNPILENLDGATKQLRNNGNYRPSKESIDAAITSSSISKFKLSDLKLANFDGEFSFFEIDTVKYDKTMNSTQKAFAQKVYGEGQNFEQNMRMLKDNKISKIRIYVLNPEYVKKNTRKGEAVARACWLSGFDYYSSFSAGYRNVDGNYGLRGVRSVEGDAKNLSPTFGVQSAYDTLLEHRKEITPEIMAGLGGLVADYLKQKA